MKKTDNQCVVKDDSFCAYGGQLQTGVLILIKK
jgi:hypothetical protein